MKNSDFYHEPVLLSTCLDYLNISPNGTFADCTLGGGGHSFAIVSRLSATGTLHAFDRDPEAIAFASKRLSAFASQVVFHPVPFSCLGEEIEPASLDGILYDLGISSRQVDSDERGFTFAGTFPLDLRMDTRQEMSAQEWLRQVSEETLAEAFRQNADLERSYKLSVQIKEFLKQTQSLISPDDIKTIAASVYPDKKRDMNGILARIFQAIRMEVNGELSEIEKSLNSAVSCLKPSGRLVVISYHSTEDRCVKMTAAKWERRCICPERQPVCTCGGNCQKLKKVLRKPILPNAEEIARNSRARSAKLRVYERV